MGIIVLCLLWLLFSKDHDNYTAARISFLIIVSVVYVPFGYLTSPGSMGVMPYITFFVIFLSSVIAVKKWEYLFPVITIAEHLGLLLLERDNPEIVPLFSSSRQRLLDLSINITVISLFIMATLYYIMRRYSAYNRNLANLSITDALTGLYNKRYIDSFAEMEFSRAEREGTPLSLVFIDLDNFKRINDQLGHLEGDKVLIETAEIIRKNIRNYDICARYGGDEFLIILPHTTEDEAMEQYERLDKFFTEYSEKYRIQGFSVSSGIASRKNLTFKEVLELADNRLYHEKEKRKSRL